MTRSAAVKMTVSELTSERSCGQLEKGLSITASKDIQLEASATGHCSWHPVGGVRCCRHPARHRPGFTTKPGPIVTWSVVPIQKNTEILGVKNQK